MNLAHLRVGYILDQIIGGFTFATIALPRNHDSPDLISISTLIDFHIPMQEYDSNCTSGTSWIYLAGSHCSLPEPEPVHASESLEGSLNTDVDHLILPAYIWEQSDVPSVWNNDWAEAAASGGGLELDRPVFENCWTKYWGAHAWFDCDPELPCECEEHNCLGTHLTEGYAPAAAATA